LQEARLMATVTVDDLEPRARAALLNSPVFELHDLEIEQRGGSIYISGAVSSFYHKQLAQEVVRSVCREIDIINQTDVRESG
jgi:hypothetical protein